MNVSLIVNLVVTKLMFSAQVSVSVRVKIPSDVLFVFCITQQFIDFFPLEWK